MPLAVSDEMDSGPREKILIHGAASLSDAELLGIVFRTGPLDADGFSGAVGLARRLLTRFDDLEGILTASPEELALVHGLGPVKVATLLAIAELRHRRSVVSRVRIQTSQDAYEILSPLALEPQENIVALFLNSQGKLIRVQTIFRGMLAACVGAPREILRAALRANAAKIILAHNHPSSDPTPSREDHEFTELLLNASTSVGLPLIDHLVVAPNGKYFSFADRCGYLWKRKRGEAGSTSQRETLRLGEDLKPYD